jgi:alanine racemase
MIKWIEIDSKILKNNIKIIKSKLKDKKLMAVVKSNAYGHGAEIVSEMASKSGADFLGVMNVYEALNIRKRSKKPIMILAPSLKDDIETCVKNKFIPTIDNMDSVKYINKKFNKKVKINLDIDTGLKRWGVELKEAVNFAKETKKLKNIELFSVSTHIAYTPYKNMIDAKEKLEKFNEEALKIKQIFPDIIVHAANSLVFLDFPDYSLDMVRIGNLIYGIYPSDVYLKRENNPVKLGIKRPWKFLAKIISVSEVKKGESFGYANEIVALKNMRIAAIPVGYSDGLGMKPEDNVYKITEGEKQWADINGKKAYFISKPSISHTLIDITEIPEAKVGTIVSLAVRRTAANSLIPRIYI